MLSKCKIYIILLSVLVLSSFSFNTSLFEGGGSIVFLSVAPLETITASSDELKGIVDFSKKTFAFSFAVNTFEGFNNPLQKEHFNEHYLESEIYPKATFTGKIVGLEDCPENCDLTIISKGKLTIHGISNVVTIPVNFKKEGRQIFASSEFFVDLIDYKITVPLILEAKIAPSIQVNVNVKLEQHHD